MSLIVLRGTGVELRVLDEEGTPRLRLESWCTTCGQRVTERLVDVSEIAAMGGGMEEYVRKQWHGGEEDAEAFNAHQTACARRN